MSEEMREQKAPIIVAAAVVIETGRVLISQRKKGSHLAGAWEFPGGKVQTGEDPRAALKRELREELGIECEVGGPVEVTLHAYPEQPVLLLFFEARRLPGSPAPRALDVADFRWATEEELKPAEFPPADVMVLARVRALLAGA